MASCGVGLVLGPLGGGRRALTVSAPFLKNQPNRGEHNEDGKNRLRAGHKAEHRSNEKLREGNGRSRRNRPKKRRQENR